MSSNDVTNQELSNIPDPPSAAYGVEQTASPTRGYTRSAPEAAPALHLAVTRRTMLPPTTAFNSAAHSPTSLTPLFGLVNDTAYNHLKPVESTTAPLAPLNRLRPTATTRARVRVSKACDKCRTQKIKCLGTHPCTTCVRHRKECTYNGPGERDAVGPELSRYNGGEEGHATIADEPHAHSDYSSTVGGSYIEGSSGHKRACSAMRQASPTYVRSLEDRVRYLESLLATNSDSVFRENINPEHFAVKQYHLLNTTSQWRFSKRHQNMLTLRLCLFVYHTLLEESRQKVAIPRTQYFGWNMSGVHYLAAEHLPDTPDCELSGLERNQLIDYFFREINALYGVLHEKVFRNQVDLYDSITGADGAAEPEPPRPAKRGRPPRKSKDAAGIDPRVLQTKLFSAQLYFILALAIRMTEFAKPRGPSLARLELEERLFKYAHRTIEVLSFEWELFELIQLWVLCSLYLRVCHRQTLSYSAFQRAVTMTRLMGIGLSAGGPAGATQYELLKAKRVFWTVYTFDRLVSLVHGRYNAIRDDEIYRPYPLADYAAERDGWLPLAAFAMFRIANVANYVQNLGVDSPPPAKLTQVNALLEELRQWLDANGLAVAFGGHLPPMVVVQIQLTFHDLVMLIHGRAVFTFVGVEIETRGFELELVVASCEAVVALLGQVSHAGLLFAPWPLTLLVAYSAGVQAVTLINAGTYVTRCKEVFQSAIKLVLALKRANVKDDAGKVICKERFTMAKECLWALKMTNHVVLLRLEEDLRALNEIGVDHGLADVNKKKFVQIGRNLGHDVDVHLFLGAEPQSDAPERPTPPQQLQAAPDPLYQYSAVDDVLAHTGDDSGEPGKELFGNLQWFDQWMDFNFDV